MGVESIAIGAAFSAAKYLLGTIAESIGGHIGYRGLSKAVEDSKELLGELVGGKIVGPFIAGGLIHTAGKVAESSAAAIKTICNNLIDVVNHNVNPSKTIIDLKSKAADDAADATDGDVLEIADKFNYSDAAKTSLQAISTLFATALMLASPASLAAPLFLAAGNAIPEIMKALNEAESEAPDLVNGLLKPLFVNVASAGLGLVAGNIVRYNTVTDVYKKSSDSYYGFGIIDAGRAAMSPEILARAENAGANVQQMVELTGKTIGLIANSYDSESTGWLATAAKVAAVVAVGFGTAALVAAAPEAAAVAAGTAFINGAASIIKWIKSPTKAEIPQKEESISTLSESNVEDAVAMDLDVEEAKEDEGFLADLSRARIDYSESFGG